MILVGGSNGLTFFNNVEKYDVDGLVTPLPNMNYNRYMY